jgi:hypothetical protein
MPRWLAIALLGFLIVAGPAAIASAQAPPRSPQEETGRKVLEALRRELMLVDETLQMQVARGALAPQEAEQQLKARCDAMLKVPIARAGLDAIIAAQLKEADLYFAFVQAAVSAGDARWPQQVPAETYRTLSKTRLAEARQGYAKQMAAGQDPALDLAVAYQWLARSRGAPGPAPTPFDKIEADVARVLPQTWKTSD